MIDKARIDSLIDTLDASAQTRLKLLWNSYITIQSNLAKDPSAKHIRDLRVAEDALEAFLEEFGAGNEPQEAFRAPEIDQPKLPPKQERFCQEYLKDLNATQAYLRAGYRSKINSAAVMAHRLLKNPNIQKRVAFLQAERAKKVEVSAEVILANIMKIANLDPDSDRTSAKWSDVLQANVQAGKHIGLFQEEGRAMDPQEMFRALQEFEEAADATVGKPPGAQQGQTSKGSGYGTLAGEENPPQADSVKPRVLN